MLIFVVARLGIRNINITTRFDQIHQLFHKILNINKILKSIKGHNSVEKFRKIMCIHHSMDYDIYMYVDRSIYVKIQYWDQNCNIRDGV